MTEERSVPFDKSFVLSTTVRHMRKSIDISISKTFDRMSEFVENQDKKIEAMETLDVLHKMRKLLEDFEVNNEHLFNKD